MKRLIPLCLIICSAILTGLGQISITVSPENFVKTGHPADDDIEYHVQITNTSADSIDLLWSKRLNSAPAEWFSWVCDPNKCYLPETTTCPENLPNPMGPGQTIEISVHVNPRNIEGSGVFVLSLLDVDGNIIGTASGDFLISLTSAGSQVAGESKLTVFPNPAHTYFQTNSIAGLKTVEVYNLTGGKMKTYDAHPQKQYFIGDLPEGMYLVRMVAANRKILKTVRLSIQ
jgi:hypothetical protein